VSLFSVNDEELHEKILQVMMVVIGQSHHGAEEFRRGITPALQAYLARTTPSEGGWEGRRLAETILQGGEAVVKASKEL